MADRREQIVEQYDDPEMLFADGLDEAIVGVVVRCGQPTLVCYDAEKCIEVLMKRDGMTYEDASEFHYVNTEGAWVGERTPVFLHRLEEDE